MPISQERLIRLVDILDEALRARQKIAQVAHEELREATDEFFSQDGNSNPLASSLLGHLQSLSSAIIDNPPISTESVETLSREREHFRISRTRNTRSAGSMARRRAQLRDRI